MTTGRMRSTRTLYALAGVAAALLLAPVAPAVAAAAPASVSAPANQLTNLDHLNFLGDTVSPPTQAGHTTYRLAQEPAIGVLWTYADLRPDGTYARVGGGPLDPVTNTWGQGSYNTDDLARAAVVYLRHWRLDGDAASRDHAYQLLRAVTYMQTTTGAHAGDVVLWMQPDGSLNPSPVPVELPNPSDSSESYWLARSVWALGEGYQAFANVDPAFAAFLGDRIDLALTALERDSLRLYGHWDVADGTRVPSWLIVDGADATAEAVLGLAAYVRSAPPSPRSARARTDLQRYAEGIAAMSQGDAASWPYGAILPWTHSQSDWHAWASQMPAGLARASAVLGRPELLRAAVTDAAVFTPALLTSTGAVNGLLPSPSDLTQIAYGVDSRVESLVAVADVTKRPGLDQLAGIAASWYFGANRAGTSMYDPATGITFDGLNADGGVNRGSGAESTIHGLLSMLALDTHPAAAAMARASTSLVGLDGVQVVEAESATLTGAAQVVTPASAWTGESSWSGGAYLSLATGARADWTVAASAEPRLVLPVVNLIPNRRSAQLWWATGDRPLGQLYTGAGGAQGVTEAPGALTPVTLARELPAGATVLSVTVRGRAEIPAQLDDVLLVPEVSHLVLAGPGGGTTLLHNAGSRSESTSVAQSGSGRAIARSYDSSGVLRRTANVTGAGALVVVLAGGFSIVTG